MYGKWTMKYYLSAGKPKFKGPPEMYGNEI